MKEVTRISEKDCFIQLRNEAVMEIAAIKVKIKNYDSMPKDQIVGDRPISKVIGGMQGKHAVKAAEMLDILASELFRQEKKLKAIDELLDDSIQ